MSKKFNIGQFVTLIEGFPFEGKIFKIVADRETPWSKANPYNFDLVSVEDGKDYIILLQERNGHFPIERHVFENEIQAYD